MTGRSQGLFPPRPQARETALGTRLSISSFAAVIVELSHVDTKLLLEQYPDIAEIGIPALCGLPEGTVSEVTLPQHCSYCLNTPQATLLSVEEVISGSWMEL